MFRTTREHLGLLLAYSAEQWQVKDLSISQNSLKLVSNKGGFFWALQDFQFLCPVRQLPLVLLGSLLRNQWCQFSHIELSIFVDVKLVKK